MSSVMRFDEWQDSNGVPVLDGTDLSIPSSALPAGTVLQVVSVTKTDAFSTNTATFADVTGLSASITPSSVSSKILVFAFVNLGTATNARIDMKIVRNSTDIAVGNGGGVTAMVSDATDLQNRLGTSGAAPSVLDSPATTSSVTYKIQVGGATNTVYVNRRESSATPLSFSSITLMEVAG